jgi:hypothetical protein
MRRLFIGALLAVLVAGSAFATETKNVNLTTLNNFKSHFTKATDVNWTTTANYAKATFTENNQPMEAFYNIDGDMIGTSKKIALDELPVRAKRSFAKRFNGYTVNQAIYLQGADEEAYYISAENEKESVIVKVSFDQYLSIFKKEKK